MKTDRTKATARALLWTATFGPLWGVGTFLALQFPLLSDPLTTVHKAVFELILFAATTWAIQICCELTLALKQGADYPRMGPWSFLLEERYLNAAGRLLATPTYVRRGCLYAFLLAALPLFIALTGTTLVALLWGVLLAAVSLAYGATTIIRYLNWKDERNGRP